MGANYAEMVEWFKAHAWKACDVKASAGSNPVLCAISKLYEPLVRTFLFVGLLWCFN